MKEKKKNNYDSDFVSMFREYDIRGRVNDTELNERNVYRIVEAYAEYLKRIKITKAVVGYDNRDCSVAFANQAIKALTDAGIDVYFIGLTLSPICYFAQYEFKAKGCVMITASHNPNGWSGFKLGCGYSKTLDSDEIVEVFNLLDTKPVKPATKGKVFEKNIRDKYIAYTTSKIKMGEYKPRVLIETANGGAGLFAYEMFERLGCVTFLLNAEPDTSYPKYFPNPSNTEARSNFKRFVSHPYIKADIGLFFDGDGDRIGIVDENGNDVWSDKLLAILAQRLLTEKPNQKIIFDVKSSRSLIETITKCGGQPIMCSTGHSFVKNKMHAENSPLAGERSGHIFIGGDDYLGFDDALFAGLKTIECLSNAKKPLSKLIGALPKYYCSSEIQIPCRDEVKYDVIKRVVARFKELYPHQVIDINGARVEFKNAWGLVRASSNLPELGLIFEGKTQADLAEVKNIFKKVLAEFKEIGTVWQNDN